MLEAVTENNIEIGIVTIDFCLFRDAHHSRFAVRRDEIWKLWESLLYRQKGKILVDTVP